MTIALGEWLVAQSAKCPHEVIVLNRKLSDIVKKVWKNVSLQPYDFHMFCTYRCPARVLSSKSSIEDSDSFRRKNQLVNSMGIHNSNYKVSKGSFLLL